MNRSIVGLSLAIILLVPIISVYAQEVNPTKLADKAAQAMREKLAKQAVEKKAQENKQKQQQDQAEQQRLEQLSEPTPTPAKTAKNPEIQALKIKIAELEKRIALLESLIEKLRLSSN